MLPFKNLLPLFLSALVSTVVIIKVEPPKSFETATLFQMGTFFVPLFFTFTFLFNLYFKFLPHSLAVSLGLIILLAFQILDSLNLVSFALTLLVVILLTKSFKKPSLQKPLSQTQNKIPKLSHLDKQK